MKKNKGRVLALLVVVMMTLSSTLVHAASWPIIEKGDKGTNVKTIQYLLMADGISLTVDGDFGIGTERAVEAFQRSVGVTIDGEVGPETWTKLIVTIQRGSQGYEVRALQCQLVKYGYSVSVDGDFGSGTESAVKNFQTNKGLVSDGIVGPLTWLHLVGN